LGNFLPAPHAIPILQSLLGWSNRAIQVSKNRGLARMHVSGILAVLNRIIVQLVLWPLYVSQPARDRNDIAANSRGDLIDDRNTCPDRDDGSNVIMIPTGASAIVTGTVATADRRAERLPELKRQKQTARLERVRALYPP
jgi:hypothetical protein